MSIFISKISLKRHSLDKHEAKTKSEIKSYEPQSNDKYRKILNDIEEALLDPELIDFVMQQYSKGSTEAEYHVNMSKRIDLLLQIAGNIK